MNGRHWIVLAASQTAMQSAGATSVQSSATVAVSGDQVLVNGSGTCAPVARVGDTVNTAEIVSGSTTVCAG